MLAVVHVNHWCMCPVQGTEPVEWRLSSAPRGMTISALSGLLSWPTTTASLTPYEVVLHASNPYGTTLLRFSVTVPPAYTVLMDPVPGGPFSSPQPVLFSGKVVFTDMESPLQGNNVPVIILCVHI